MPLDTKRDRSNLSPHLHTSTGRANALVIRATTTLAVAAAVAGAAIGWRSSHHLETLWDEHVDRTIAQGLAQHPLTGERPTIDASQTRLPMYVNAAAFALTGRSDLAISRGVSLVVGAATVLAAALLGQALFGPLVGVLAALLLAFSPYFLSFARISMTEGDIFFACFLTWAIWGFVRYRACPSAGRWMAAGVLTGLAVGAKAFAVVPIAVLLAEPAMFDRPHRQTPPAGRENSGAVMILLLTGVVLLLATAAAAWFSQLIALFLWVVLTGFSACAVAFILRRKAVPTGVHAMTGLALLAVLAFGVLMPVHITGHEIARTIVARLFQWDHQVPLARCVDHLRLYSGIVLIKSTVPLGVITVASLIYGIARLTRDAAWRLCLLPTVAYIAALCFLPLRQTFYLMGVYPLLMLMTAAMMVSVGRLLRRGSRLGGVGWAVFVIAMLIHLELNVHRAYPHFHLHGYDLVGERWLGAESRGYRNLIQTPSDGVESLIRWCNADPRVRPGSRIVSFLWEDQPGQMVDDLLPANPHYTLIRRGLTGDSDAVPPAPSIDDADFVLLHINNLLGYGDRSPDHPALDQLLAEFEPVYTVARGPLEVAWVYARRR